MNKFKTFSIISTIFLFSFIEKVLALSNTYPTIAGRTLRDDTTFSELVLYLFILIIAIGAALMFVIAVKVGLGMVTGGNTAEAKKKLKSSVIGFCVLVSVYLLINTINPSILNIIDIEGQCIDGAYVKTKEKIINTDGTEEDKFSYSCIGTDNANLPEIEEDMESVFTPCLLKMAIGYPEADYQGSPTILFNDMTDSNSGCPEPSIKLKGYKSVRLLTKLGGVYLYSKEGLQIEQNTSSAPVFTKSSIDNFANLGLDNKIKSFEALDIAYNPYIVDPTNENNLIMNDFYYGITFKDPEYRGECSIFDETFEKEDVSSIITIRSRERQKTGNKNYIYLYPVKDCGENIDKDKDAAFVNEEKNKESTFENNKDKDSIFSLLINGFSRIVSYVSSFSKMVFNSNGNVANAESSTSSTRDYFDYTYICGSSNQTITDVDLQKLNSEYQIHGSPPELCSQGIVMNNIVVYNPINKKYTWDCYDEPGATVINQKYNTNMIGHCFAYSDVGTNGLCGSAYQKDLGLTPPSSSDELCRAGTPTEVTNAAHKYYWTCQGTNGGETAKCSANRGSPGSGACGAAASMHFDIDEGIPDDAELCASGWPDPTILTYHSDSSIPWFVVWVCKGTSTAYCKGYFSPKCVEYSDNNCETIGGYAGYNFPPAEAACKAGGPHAVRKVGNGYEWKCGSYDNVNPETIDCSCGDTSVTPEPAVDPVCGSSNGKYFSNKPTANLCKAGTIGSEGVSGSNPWNWKCVSGEKSVTCASLEKNDSDDPGYDPGTEESTDPEMLKKVCKIEIPAAGTSAKELEKTIKEECGDVFDKGDGDLYDVISFKLDAPAAVVVRGSNDKCIYFDMANIERGGSCIGDLRGSDVFDTSKTKGAARPRDLIIVSKE